MLVMPSTLPRAKPAPVSATISARSVRWKRTAPRASGSSSRRATIASLAFWSSSSG
jgi:hypothetical protein